MDKADEHLIRFVSGEAEYVESMRGDRWCGRRWSIANRGAQVDFWESKAFELGVRLAPSIESPELLLAAGWRWVSTQELATCQPEARHLVVTLSNTLRDGDDINVQMHTWLDGTPVLARWLEIASQCREPFAMTRVSPWSGRLWSTAGPVSLGHSLKKEVGWEGWFGWEPLAAGANVFRNDTDRLWDEPGFVLRHETAGEYFIGQLEWAANYCMAFHCDAGLSFDMEPIAPKALRVVEPGETVRSPAMHLGCVRGDFDHAVQAMHDHIRRSVLPERQAERAYRSQYLVPGDWNICHYPGESFDETNMLTCIDVAAAAGLEVFILDGPTWVSGYGDWLTPHHRRFPRGLAPLIERAHATGLLFGLYFETEGGRDGDTSAVWDAGARIGRWQDSAVFQAHPEWFSRTNLDLTNPEASAYLEAELGRIIEYYQLDLYRHDANGIVFFPPGPGGGMTLRSRSRFVESDAWRYYDALNSLIGRVGAQHPRVILQQASAGGYRLDLGTARIFHEHFASDAGGQLHSFRRLAGLSVFLPPEVVVNAFGLCPPQDLPDLDTSLRGAYALGFTPMFFTTLLPATAEGFSPGVREQFLRYAALYKTFIRPLLGACKVYHHAPVNASGGVESGDWLAMEFTSPDQAKGWATIVHLARTDATYRFTPKGLNEQWRYAVTFDNTATQETRRGADLARNGLVIRAPPDRCSELILFEMTDKLHVADTDVPE